MFTAVVTHLVNQITTVRRRKMREVNIYQMSYLEDGSTN